MRTESVEDAENLIQSWIKNGQIKFPSFVFLNGPLGAGKTFFVQCLRKILHPEGHAATSPTFTIENQYAVPEGTIFHFDLYRLEHWREWLDLALMERDLTKSIVLIEWANRFPMENWKNYLFGSEIPVKELTISILDGASRDWILHPFGILCTRL